eukprot:CAMPEP_0185257484 /NCGR_PEP_ID=MMETSP1359-20130426/6545_1 /TAXON_ID=552665 /ORGANISM="Bigelowiella longifila, Strain CCMP242" /LENGTH=135 /DNA_ID=CAMNT_0027842605 /DNA_START=914 /DNA_END=1318 /DNA_ORIENTATION=-
MQRKASPGKARKILKIRDGRFQSDTDNDGKQQKIDDDSRRKKKVKLKKQSSKRHHSFASNRGLVSMDFLSEIAEMQKEEWMPRVTLGKMRASKEKLEFVGKSLIQNSSDPHQLSPFPATALQLHGFIPKQVDLDW